MPRTITVNAAKLVGNTITTYDPINKTGTIEAGYTVGYLDSSKNFTSINEAVLAPAQVYKMGLGSPGYVSVTIDATHTADQFFSSLAAAIMTQEKLDTTKGDVFLT